MAPAGAATIGRVTRSFGRALGAVTLFMLTAAMACKVNVDSAMAPIDERGQATWTVDGAPVEILKTYFLNRPPNLWFAVEWTCSDCAPKQAYTQVEAYGLAQPVLWEAARRGEMGRTNVNKLGEGRVLVDRYLSVMHYSLGGGPETARLEIRQADGLLHWMWPVGDRNTEIHQPGYYFDTDDQRLYFTVSWYDPAVCGDFDSLDQESADRLTLPVMQEVLRRRLFDTLPRIGEIPAAEGRPVESIGVAIACPDPSCVGRQGCPTRSWRTSRLISELETLRASSTSS